MKRKAIAVWNGSLKDGQGNLTTDSQVLDKTAYSFHTRFEDVKGTNPEELLAAAHAGCFTMQLSANLTEAGHSPDELRTQSAIIFENGKIVRSELTLEAKVPGISEEEFQKWAKHAEENCPVSKSFNFEITLDAKLVD